MSYIVNYALKRTLHHNQNWMCAIVGQTGSGKSYVGLRLLEEIYKAQSKNPMDYVKNVCFTPEDFMNRLNSKDLTKGDVLIFDEAGVGLGHRDWFTLVNKAFAYVAQTFRHQNLSVIFTSPSFHFIDKSVRVLFHSFIETISINRERKQCITKYKNIEANPDTGKLYKKFPRIKQGNNIIKLDRICFNLPSKELRRAYDKKQISYKKNLNAELLSQINRAKAEKDKKSKALMPDDMVAEIVKNKKEYLRTYNKRTTININLVRNRFGLGRVRAKEIKALAEKELGII